MSSFCVFFVFERLGVFVRNGVFFFFFCLVLVFVCLFVLYSGGSFCAVLICFILLEG